MNHHVANAVTAPRRRHIALELTSLLVATSACLATPAVAQISSDAVQWRMEDGGNGHWYALEIISETFCPRDNYVTDASVRGAYPVTIQSAAENDFILELIPQFHPVYSTAILGCVRDEGAGWRWLNGEEWTYDNWIYGQGQTQSEPTASIYDESSSFGPGWHDYPGECHGANITSPTSLIFEWSADCNGDGIVDYGQILDGTFDDLDQNGVPDCCDAGEACGNGGAIAVQWRVEDGGNGHWYAFRYEPMPASQNCWSRAVEHARAQGGDLLALSSLDEEAFVVAALCDQAPLAEVDGQHYYGWIGFTGTGTWSNGEPEIYIHWGASGPSGDGPHVRMRGLNCQVYGWNDVGGSDGCHPTGADALYYTMEWEADCNGDGIVDYGQILDGTFADLNGNGVPDCCDAGEPCGTDCVGDITGNGVVDSIDLGILLAVWGTDGKSKPETDIDGDGIVGAIDLGLLLGGWGACPEG